jgi:NAD(P)H-hydrate repair Nnr-like enzyme with NAD(P)H-hydrate dehydratase domain
MNAAIIAVYLHGLTADIAIPETGLSLYRSDIISNIGEPFNLREAH